MTITRLTRSGVISALAVLALSGCGLASAGDGDRTISIIVTESEPYQEPTEIAKELLAEEGWTLQPTYVTDIVQPNQVVSEGEYDANFFQHAAYLRQFNEDNDTLVEPAFTVYDAPAGVFSVKYDTLDDLPDGAQISLPVDRSNNGRALQLLADEGLIEVDQSVSVTELSQESITDNPKNLEFIEIDQQSSAQTLPDVDAGFSTTRFQVEAGYDVQDTMLAFEDYTDLFAFSVIVGVGDGERDSEKIQALQDAFQSEEVEQWYEQYLDGALPYNGQYTTENIGEQWETYLAE
ncbi:MetQ/NlpA family ABC transporter substrate-binding protein [Yaniella halotolerans]|uniref:MetQ/NlpA family ABC transporter substrate-binding protein n=1 Tax=Yaniella halotolerans TaxID=225453 RepID=UPI0003B3D9FA|nr:MetQ/NlpA family ABC transporter substrate-binding protein [Yaniella halotolerans]